MGSTFQRSAQNMLLGSRKNVLLVKDDVGMAKPTTKDLPGDDFAFGRDKRYVESAQQGTSHQWLITAAKFVLFLSRFINHPL